MDDDAWVIFTSGSTGVPKGVAVSHRSAAAFVDAEARMFLQDSPIGPGDRVLAGLSVAFDASCEEMWLAWGHGACLVPAPRSLVRTGMDLGPWLVAQEVTVVSTVPTLAALWPAEALEPVRLLVFGGEACPPELAERLVTPEREVWNTYGPTEATVVACGARLDGTAPIRIGLPLDGWDLAVVGPDDQPVAAGETGQLIIGGVGLARYLDPAKDAEKYAAMPTLGLGPRLPLRRPRRQRPRRARLRRTRRRAGQARRPPDRARRDRRGPAVPPPRLGGSGGGPDDGRRQPGARRLRRPRRSRRDVRPEASARPAPRGAAGGARAGARPRRDAADPHLRQGGPGTPCRGRCADADDDEPSELSGTAAWLAGHWTAVLGTTVRSAEADFFDHGGGSLSSARLVSLLRERYPTVTVADVHARPRLGAQADLLDTMDAADGSRVDRTVRRIPRRTQLVQTVVSVVLLSVKGLQWLVALATLTELLRLSGLAEWSVPVSWWALAVGWVAFISPLGRMGLSALAARALLAGVRPGSYPRGGSVQLRLWAAERFADAMGAITMAGAPWIIYYARMLGASIGPGVDLHSVPPITGMLTIGAGASIEPEVDLSGYWIDGDVVHVGPVHIGREAVVGARSTIGPDVHIGREVVVEAGSTVLRSVRPGRVVAGSPAQRVSAPGRPGWPDTRPPEARAWLAVYGISGVVLSILPFLALLPGVLLARWAGRASAGPATWSARHTRRCPS